jgi:5-methylthioadenosine/S-adenosylhomocysteine deaminase
MRGGRVLGGSDGKLNRADVLIDRDRVVAVGPDLSAPPGSAVIDARGRLVLPGLVNAHTHAHNNLFTGLANRWTLEDLLNYASALNSNRTPEDQYLSAALGAIEMLKTGCTAAYDLFTEMPVPTDEGVEAVARAYTDVGLRAVIAPSVADMVFYGTVPGLVEALPVDLRRTVEQMATAPTEGLLRLFEGAVRRWNGSADGRIRVALSPTIPAQCSDEFLSGCARLLREYDVGLHTHLAETKVEALYARHRWGGALVPQLTAMGIVGPRFVAAHGVWLTDEDVRRLADAGGMLAHNPASNLKLGCGIAPIREMLDQGLHVGLGTDGAMSSDNLNMFESMRFAALVGTIRFPHQPERWIDARTVWDMATRGSARLLSMADDIGRIAQGCKADLIVLRAESGYLRPLNDVVNALVYRESGADVETVLIDGRVVLENGRVLTVDEERLRAGAEEAAERVRARNEPAWTLADRLRPYLTSACIAVARHPFAVNRYAVPASDQA